MNLPEGSDWLPGLTLEDADASMSRVVEMARSQAIPFFDLTESVEGLMAQLEHLNWGTCFEQACCEAKLGRVKQAATLARRAAELYQEEPWGDQYIELCDGLLSAIKEKNTDALLWQWTEQSVAKLGVKKLNPFRLARSCLTPTVVALARAIHTERAIDRMPILADALEEAGCTDQELLQCCRQSCEYVKAVWVLNAVSSQK